MARYDPLERHLAAQHGMEIELSFGDVERIIGGALPKAAGYAKFWASQTRSMVPRPWTLAGFDASLVPGERRIRFLRRGYKVVSRGDGVTFIAKENPSEEEVAQGRQAWENLIKLLARAAVDASHKLGITFDMDDPQVARDVMKASFDGVFGLRNGRESGVSTLRSRKDIVRSET